jgi:hypothetical protein
MEFFTSKEIYDESLKLFNGEARKSGRGYTVFVTGEYFRNQNSCERDMRAHKTRSTYFSKQRF